MEKFNMETEMKNSMLELLFSIRTVSLYTVLPGTYVGRNIPVKKGTEFRRLPIKYVQNTQRNYICIIMKTEDILLFSNSIVHVM
jgi:hypothetical protein